MMRLTPWFTDGAVRFLNGFLKWSGPLSEVTGHPRVVLELGGGASTFFFLQKGFDVVSVEGDERWRRRVDWLARDLGFEVDDSGEASFDGRGQGAAGVLQLVSARSAAEIPGWVFDRKYSVLVNDGVDRWRGLDALLEFQTEELLIADNLEYASDWGTLPVSAGYPERARAWRSTLRDRGLAWLLFEQPEGREGFSSADVVGLERPGRKITGVSWRRDAILDRLGVTAEGSCVVSPPSSLDEDLEDLRERCPYPTEDQLFTGLTLPRDHG